MTDAVTDAVTVRRAVTEDDAALLEIEKISWDASSGFPSYLDRLEDTFFQRTGPEDHLVAELDGQVVGYLRLEDKYKFPEGAGVLTINGLAISPTARRRGVASALLRAAESEARRRNARKITLNVHAVNAPAQTLYKSHGYTIEGTHPEEFLIEGQLIAYHTMALIL